MEREVEGERMLTVRPSVRLSLEQPEEFGGNRIMVSGRTIASVFCPEIMFAFISFS